MKYETPELTALAPAISAIQGDPKESASNIDGSSYLEPVGVYADWE